MGGTLEKSGPKSFVTDGWLQEGNSNFEAVVCVVNIHISHF